VKIITATMTASITAIALCIALPARADINADLIPLPAVQLGTDGFISFGTVVTATTNINSIWASANYRIECSDPAIRPALSGGRGWSNNGIRGPRSITVTAPEWLPAVQELPGWQAVMGGTLVSCVHTSIGYAKTNILPIGSGGTTIPIGGDSWEETETNTFTVMKPGTSFGGGCIM
jgi:hypothetical protein